MLKDGYLMLMQIVILQSVLSEVGDVIDFALDIQCSDFSFIHF